MKKRKIQIVLSIIGLSFFATMIITTITLWNNYNSHINDPLSHGMNDEQGPQGDKGEQGPQGEKGDKGEQGPQGEKGDKGEQGESGALILGSYESLEELKNAHPTGTSGNGYLVDGELYIWDSNAESWERTGNLRGEKGEQGPQGEAGPQGKQGPQGEKGEAGPQGEQGPQGLQGETGPQGEQGPQGLTGTDGFSPEITVIEDNQFSYILQIKTKDGVFVTPNLKTVSKIYSANISQTGAFLEVPVGNLIYRLENTGTDLRLRVGAADGKTILADIKKFAQYNATGVEGATYDNTSFTNFVTVDTLIYNSTNELNIMRIRQRDTETQLWSICDVYMFSSAGGARTDVWVEWKGLNISYN